MYDLSFNAPYPSKRSSILTASLCCHCNRFSATSDSAVIDKDFSFQSKEVTFKPGEIYHSINIPILKDDWTEDDEKFTISMTSVDGVISIVTPGSVTITISSNGKIWGMMVFLKLGKQGKKHVGGGFLEKEELLQFSGERATRIF